MSKEYALFSISPSKEDEGRGTRSMGKESTKLSQIMDIQDNLTPSFIFNFLLENFTWVGRELNWLI